MDLSPKDLGSARYLTTLRRRLSPFATQPNGVSSLNLDEAEVVETRKGRRRVRGRRLRRYWVKDLGLDGETSEKLGAALWKGLPGLNVRIGATIASIYMLIPALIVLLTGGPPAISFAIFLAWAMVIGLVLSSPRNIIRKVHNKMLTVSEVEHFLPNAHGRLDRTFLSLILDALKTDVPSETAQNDIKSALQHLGDTVARLPAEAVPVTDPGTLRQEAAERRDAASRENDSFVRASLIRQAEGYERRANLSDENVVSARRLSALRREARVQMDSLRAVLVAFQNTSQTDATSVANLSDAVSRVAQEAQAVSIARRELEEDEISRLFGKPLPENIPVQPVAVPVAVQPAQAPQPQVVQSRNWWRNQS